MITRRDFLKIVPTALASGMIGLPNPQQAQPIRGASLNYGGPNFEGWEVALGDGVYPTTPGAVTRADIQTVNFPTYSELRANVKRRAIMAHNITFNRIIDANALNYILTGTYKFRLPYLPVKDPRKRLNGETVEGGIFVWDGPKTRKDYGMAFQWMINPWVKEFGFIRSWTNIRSKSDTNGSWKSTGFKLIPDMNWHEAKMVVDIQRETTSLSIDGKHCLTQFTINTKPETWGTEVAARLQAEIISVNPEPSGMRAVHKVQFKDWTWVWEPI